MNCVLKSFDIVKDGKVIAHFELFKNGYRNEVRNKSFGTIFTGAGADQYYDKCLEDNLLLSSLINDGTVIIEKYGDGRVKEVHDVRGKES